MNPRTLGAAALAGTLLSLAAPANAQVVINEVFENPPGSTDDRWEFIELYGRPGTDLTGMAVAVLKGGIDTNGDNIPDGDPIDRVPEIDEAFALDGLTLGPEGLFTLYQRNVFGSSIEDNLTPNPAFNNMMPITVQNRPFIDGIDMAVLHIPTTDTVGMLANDNSSTYVIVRKRPHHEIMMGTSVYAGGYAFRKDVDHDVNFDGKTDFGSETPIPIIGQSPSAVQPFQMVDDVAWSNSGGKEYVLDSEQEISDTPGFNPDGLSRINFFLENPMIGHRSRDLGGGAFEILPTRTADEEWVFGEVLSVTGAGALEYNFGVDADGFAQYRTPTDVNATPYDGTCDPDPDDEPADGSCAPNPMGTFYFDGLDIPGFALTPGGFNDFDAETLGGTSVTQYRFTRGDFNFDGVVDQADLDLIAARADATLDDQFPDVYDNGTPGDPSDDVPFLNWTWQGRGFQQTLMMLEMDLADGEGGVNEVFITTADIQAVADMVPSTLCPGDCDDSGTVDFNDLVSMLFEFGTPGSNDACDADETGNVDFNDLVTALFLFGPCP